MKIIFSIIFIVGVKWVDVPDMKNTFNNFGPDDSPERIDF
jgi:hypothetical protein